MFCSLPDAADAGSNGDGGLAQWMCRPGTYFCDRTGDLGDCFQCRSDSDCADQSLPTYDPLRPRCDLDSGIAGYVNFCQECLSNADCAANPAGSLCDANPAYPPSALEPPIEALGFEDCGRVQTDCRLEGGPDCHAANQVCDPFNGECMARSASCTTDQDCVGLLVASGSSLTGSPYLPNPYCVDGGCTSCPGGVCPTNNTCQSDADCGNPSSSPASIQCQPFIVRLLDGGIIDEGFQCACTSSAQCSGFWPACTRLDAGYLSDAGQSIGVCSCDGDAECGDGGLACLPPHVIVSGDPMETIFGAQAGQSFCGVPCTSPEFPSCLSLTGYAICDIQSRICGYCEDDEQCMSSVGSGGPFCGGDYNGPPFCACLLDSDCPAGDSCLAYGPTAKAFLGTCVPTFSRCAPGSCGGFFCNWDTGACVNGSNVESFPSCLNDADCGGGAPVCVEGACAECGHDADCVHAGPTRATVCCSRAKADSPCDDVVVPHVCVTGCGTDADCVGNLQGPRCLSVGGNLSCGCGADQDCAGNARGPHCDTDPEDTGLYGQCTCVDATECAAGWQCNRTGVTDAGSCTPDCINESCAAGFACGSGNLCRPECVDSRDCDGGLGCVGNACEPCRQTSDCFAGSVCLADGLCHAGCESGPCPAGEVCDVIGQAGGGANICYLCASSADCPDGRGCNHQTHACGTCLGPTAGGGPYDCPPDAVCSDYWGGGSGVCLQNCDREACPADRPICAALPSLTPDHRYCFGCLQDVDCGDAGAWCDQSFNRTFTCQPAVPASLPAGG